MIFSRVLAASSALASSLASLIFAIPFRKRDVWVPEMTLPTFDAVLGIGKTYTVTWSLADKLTEVTNPNGWILLMHDEVVPPSGSVGLNDPLAEGFLLTNGEVDIMIPNVNPDGNHQLVLERRLEITGHQSSSLYRNLEQIANS